MKDKIAVPAGPEKIVCSANIVQVVHQDMKIGDKVEEFEWVRRSPGTRTIVFDKKNNKILLTKEYRYELKTYDYRIPGGKVCSLKEYIERLKNTDEQNMKLITEAAKRELEEETGIKAKSLKHIYTSNSGTTVRWDLYYFVAEEFEQGKQNLGFAEPVETGWYSPDEVENFCMSAEISEDRSVAVLLRFLKGTDLVGA